MSTTVNNIGCTYMQTSKNKKKIEKLIAYARSKYSVEFSKRFDQMIKKGEFEAYTIPDTKVIDALVKEWEIWKPYVSPESFSNFVEMGLKSLILIRATATFHTPKFNGYIGTKARVICDIPVLATCISKGGELYVNGQLM